MTELVIKSDKSTEGVLSISQHKCKVVIEADHPLAQFPIMLTLTDDDVYNLRHFLDSLVLP